jgi:hypothetical protein
MARFPRIAAVLEQLLRPARYRIDADRFVDRVDETTLRYHEHNRSIMVGYEALKGGEMGLFPSQIERWEPYRDGDVVDEAERKRILENVRRALESRGIKVANPEELVPGDSLIWMLDDRDRTHDGP